jgi:uncharacterized protein YndB with AHSA1/START domain
MTGDQVTVSVTAPADPAAAFAFFTEETDQWWQRGPKFRMAGRNPGTIRFEPRAGGRLLEEFDSPDGPHSRVMGTITEWDPPRRFAFDWRGVNFAPGESTRVAVTFEPVPTGTRVTVRHSGWASLRPDHPVRHGQGPDGFIRMIGMWWGELASAFRDALDADQSKP